MIVVRCDDYDNDFLSQNIHQSPNTHNKHNVLRYDDYEIDFESKYASIS